MISAVFVSYRSGKLAVAAIESLRREADAGSLALQVIAVVNSGDEDEAAELRAAADVTLVPLTNLGYAGGINRGLAEARGETLLLANPDLVFLPGSLGALLEAMRSERLSERLSIAGPAFHLDQGETLLVPPFEEPHPFDVTRRRLGYDERSDAMLFRRHARRTLRIAAAVKKGESVPATALAGALLALTRECFEAIGPFDEGYRLYFEENDWQRRLRKRGGRLVYVGGSRVIHRYNQSARSEPRSTGWFAESEQRFFSTHFPGWGERALDILRAAPAPRRPLPSPLPSGELRWTEERGVGLAVSPSSNFRPFAFVSPGEGQKCWRAPADFLEGIRGASWFARAFALDDFRTLAEGAIPSDS